MPAGYTKSTNTAQKVVWRKRFKNNETARVVIEQTPGGNWFGHVEDAGRTATELGRFNTKDGATRAANTWMRNHPKGAAQQGGSGVGLFSNGQNHDPFQF